MSKIICFNLLNVYPHMQKHIFCWKSTPYFITKSPTFRGWRKEVLGSQKAYSSHIVKQGNKPMPANTHQWVPHGLKSGQVQPSTLLPPGFWSFCSYTCPPTENPTSWHTTQEYYLRSYWLELSGNFWVIFLKKGKHPNITEKTKQNQKNTKNHQRLYFVQLSGFVPNWREQLANSSKAVRIFVLSLLWLNFLPERHDAGSTIHQYTASGPRAATESPFIPLDSFPKGVLVVRMEHNTTPTESMYLNCSEHGSWTFLLHAW